MSSGLTLNRALALSSEGSSAAQKKAVDLVLESVESGGLLSSALFKHVGISRTTSGLIGHGESSGELVSAFSMSRELLEREDELVKKCTGAMAYPFVIGIFALLLTIGLMKGVMPQIIPMLESLHVQLPFLTRAVIFLSQAFMRFGLIGAGVVVVLATGCGFLYRKVPRFRWLIHEILAHTPLVGTLVRAYALSVFMRSCGALLETGLPIAVSFLGTADSVSFLPLRYLLQSHSESVGRGVALDLVFKHKSMPPFVAALVHAGEVSGTLGKSMSRAGAILDRDIEHSLKRLTSLIEPVMMIGMGGIVGSIALSIMMPIYDISRVLQHS